MGKDTYLRKIFGDERFEEIRITKVVMVGAGGIGCELLKNLVLAQFGEIHVVDLDSITLSNLNRQFLFRHQDIDRSKSLTVAKAVEAFNYHGSKLVPHHGNVMDTNQFPLSWWDQFDYVYNALDNLEARRYVNKLCLFLKKPLMESGTTGYEGQVQPIYPYYSECFECQPKATPMTFPVCTIRSTPSQPVHCITWSKEFLFNQLFSERADPEELKREKEKQRKALEAETEDKKEIEYMLKETNEIQELRDLINSQDESRRKSFVHDLIVKCFQVDIERSLAIESLWKNRTKPKPLYFDDLYASLLESLRIDEKNEEILTRDTKVWNILENIYVLLKSCESLQQRVLDGESSILFDKDDEDTLNFVVASSNLRCYIFGIEVKSKFDTKQIAGNIIPAIATTNAIISGFSCLGSLAFYSEKPNHSNFLGIAKRSSAVFTSIRPNKYITSAALEGPNSMCPSCLVSLGILNIYEEDYNNWTLGHLVDNLKKLYNYEDEISLILGKSSLIYDYDFDDNLSKKLRQIKGFTNGELLLIQDEEDILENLELYLTIDNTATKFPTIMLREKINPEPLKNGQDENGDNVNGLIIDVENDGLIELDDEPATKRRKINS